LDTIIVLLIYLHDNSNINVFNSKSLNINSLSHKNSTICTVLGCVDDFIRLSEVHNVDLKDMIMELFLFCDICFIVCLRLIDSVC